MTFSLVAYLMIAGQIHGYGLDSGLTYEDCQAGIQAGVSSVPELPSDISAKLASAPLVCVIETN